MTAWEIIEKANHFSKANDEEGYEKLIESLSDEEYVLFADKMKEIEELIESVSKIKPFEKDELPNILIHIERGE